jgi:hypothetical protein
MVFMVNMVNVCSIASEPNRVLIKKSMKSLGNQFLWSGPSTKEKALVHGIPRALTTAGKQRPERGRAEARGKKKECCFTEHPETIYPKLVLSDPRQRGLNRDRNLSGICSICGDMLLAQDKSDVAPSPASLRAKLDAVFEQHVFERHLTKCA